MFRYYHSAVIVSGGALYMFGRNDYGQLGLGHRETSWRPQVLLSLFILHITRLAAFIMIPLSSTDCMTIRKSVT